MPYCYGDVMVHLAFFARENRDALEAALIVADARGYGVAFVALRIVTVRSTR